MRGARFRRSGASGVRRSCPTRWAGRSLRVGSFFPTVAPSSRPPRPSGFRSCSRRSATRSEPRAGGSASCSSPRSLRRRRPSSSRSEGARPSTGARVCASACGSFPSRPSFCVTFERGSPTLPGCSVPRREHPRRSPTSSSGASRRCRSSGRSRICPDPVLLAGSARHSLRSEASSSPEPRRSSTLSASTSVLASHDLVVTGEGQIDATTAEGKAPGEIARRCAAAGVRCVVFGGRVRAKVPGAETVALSGDPITRRGRSGRARPATRRLTA